MQSTYLTSAQKATQLPRYDLPEIAFIGRSNCGKSSLLNTLLGRKNLARSSTTPGRTQMVNFFSLQLTAEHQKLIFADLPGYGFNVAKREIRKLWDSLLSTYMERDNICEFLYLLDIRRDFDDFEYEYMRELSQRCPLVIVLTKADKVKKSEALQKKQQVSQLLLRAGVLHKEVFIVSNLKRTGIDRLQQLIFAHASQGKATASGDEAPGDESSAEQLGRRLPKADA